MPHSEPSQSKNVCVFFFFPHLETINRKHPITGSCAVATYHDGLAQVHTIKKPHNLQHPLIPSLSYFVPCILDPTEKKKKLLDSA